MSTLRSTFAKKQETVDPERQRQRMKRQQMSTLRTLQTLACRHQSYHIVFHSPVSLHGYYQGTDIVSLSLVELLGFLSLFPPDMGVADTLSYLISESSVHYRVDIRNPSAADDGEFWLSTCVQVIVAPAGFNFYGF